MAHVEQSVEIRRPCEDVFAYVTTLDRWWEWADLVIDRPWSSPAPLHEGATFTVVTRFEGRTLAAVYRVTTYEPPRRLVVRTTSGAVPVTVAYTCEPLAGGTRFTQAWDFEPRNVFKLAVPLMVAAARRSTAKSLANLKERLETPG